MSKKKETMELAKVDVNDTTALIQLLDAKLAEVKKVEDTPYKTNGDMTEHGFSTNIKNETKVEILVRMASVGIAKERAYGEAITELGLTTVPAITFGTGTLDNLLHDIKLRIAIIQQDDQAKLIKKAKEDLSKFMSAEEQKQLIMADLMKSLGLSK